MKKPLPRGRWSGRHALRSGYTIYPYGGGPVTQYNEVLKEWLYEELVVSESHRQRAFGVFTGGGPFLQWRAQVRHEHPLDLSFYRWGNRFESHLIGVDPIRSLWGGDYPPLSDLRPSYGAEALIAQSYGPAAYRKTRPGNPVAHLGQFLGELRDLPQIPFKNLVSWPRIRSLAGVPFRNWGRALYNRLRDFYKFELRVGNRAFLKFADSAVKPGGEYLNVVFGWRPFLQDLVSAWQLSLVLEEELRKLVRENGKGIHRRTTLKDDTTNADLSTVSPYPWPWEPYSFIGGPGAGGPSGYGVGGSTVHRYVKRVKERVWFSGRYRYWIPDVQSIADRSWHAFASVALYGLLPTPSLVWELLPFSWLLDWFVNFGDVISNVSTNAVENLVLEYGFIMRHRTETWEASAHVQHDAIHNGAYNNWPAVNHTFSSAFQVETKARATFNPFFPGSQAWVFEPGSNLPPFSAKQWSILAALGLSVGLNR